MKMKVLLVVIAMLTILAIRPSSAQDESDNMGCWVNITNCLQGSGEVIECCPIIQQAIDDQRDCFCMMRETIVQNATLDSSLSTIFTFCSITDSIQTLCPAGSDNSSSDPLASPPSSEPGPPPVEEPSAPVEEPSTAVEEPSPPSRTVTPTTDETSIPSPAESPTTDDDGGCWSRITSCTDTTSESDILQCCPVFKQEIANERECFCAAKDIDQDPADVKAFTQFLTLCNIRGTFNTLCPDANNSTGKGSKGRSASISGTSTNKIAHSVGLLPSSLLIIWGINVLIGYQ